MIFPRLGRNICTILPNDHMSQHRIALGLFEIFVEPRQCSFECVDAMSWFAQTVPLTRITDQHCVYAAPSQSHVHLFCLRDVNVVVLFTVNEHGRRLDLLYVTKG